ncbi:MAG: isoprenylcysteine carboxylmethyltransferase family protein [Crocinitomicaceae bacterium]|nr:isoprenylcysteine carboxylmethyltransferase family protein [Crocinitomicaceae bacterium]
MQTKTKKKIGNLLFKYRGQFPLFIVLISIPFVYNERKIESSSLLFEIFFSLLLVFLGHAIRSLVVGHRNLHSSGKNRDQQVAEKLNTTGIYSMLRHPLYFGNFFIWIGLLTFIQNLYFLLLGVLFFLFLYYFIFFVEEEYLRVKFKDEHKKWAKKTPIFLPSFSNYKKPQGSFNWKMVWKNEYPGICASLSCIWFIQMLKVVFMHQQVPSYLIVWAMALVLFGFGSKYLKHKTNFFPKEG